MGLKRDKIPSPQTTARMGLEAKVLFNQNNRNALRYNLSIDDEQFIHCAIDAIAIHCTLVFKWQRVLMNAAEPLIEMSNQFLSADYIDDFRCARHARPHLASAH